MSPEEKWTFLRDAPSGDAKHAQIRELAALLMRAASDDATRFAQLAHTVARDWIRQVTDTVRIGREDIAGLTREPRPDDAVDALRRGVDDCDAKARLFCALCLAVGVPARMQDWWTRGDVRELVHVSAQVFLQGKWRPVELTLARARLDELGSSVPHEKGTNEWKVS